ncbi:MAG: hypothetical protein QM528_07535 [Phycisphaerales bacterium]|nr:hypothetical protein [Phycisphaerales bacterium]
MRTKVLYQMGVLFVLTLSISFVIGCTQKIESPTNNNTNTLANQKESSANNNSHSGFLIAASTTGTYALYPTNDGGTTWLTPIIPYVPISKKEVHIDAACYSGNKSITLVYNQQVNILPVISTDGGQSWDPNASPIIWPWPLISNVTYSSSHHGIIYGSTGSIHAGKNIGCYSYTRDGGQTWSPIQRIKGMSFISSVAFATGGWGVLMGLSSGASPVMVYATTNDEGETWTLHDISMLGNYHVNISALLFQTPFHVIAIGYSNENDGACYFNSFNYGKSWSDIGLIPNGRQFTPHDMAFTSPNNHKAIAVGSGLFNNGSYSVTEDGGQTWLSIDTIPGWKYMTPMTIKFYAPNEGIIAGFDGKSDRDCYVSITTNGGQTWSLPAKVAGAVSVPIVLFPNP